MARMSKRILKSAPVLFLARWMIRLSFLLIWLTRRWTVQGEHIPGAYWERNQPFILAFWHGRIMTMTHLWRSWRPMHVLVSLNRDGEVIVRAVRLFGVRAIRGSAPKAGQSGDKGGLAAMREMLKVIKQGHYVGITPDGPRGPRMRVHEGIITFARFSGVPIIPFVGRTTGPVFSKSWDRFIWPLPFCRGVMLWGEPILVGRDCTGEAAEAKRQELENAMNALAAKADAMLGIEPILPAPASTARVSNPQVPVDPDTEQNALPQRAVT